MVGMITRATMTLTMGQKPAEYGRMDICARKTRRRRSSHTAHISGFRVLDSDAGAIGLCECLTMNDGYNQNASSAPKRISVKSLAL